MKDPFFSTKRYQGLYTPIYRFSEFGDTENYWIELQYLCNRDDWQSVRSTIGSSLDFDLKNEDGVAIFGEIQSEHLSALIAKNYILGGISEPEAYSDDGSIISVREIYVYAPDKTYTIYDSDIVPIWGIKDTDYATQSPIVFGSDPDNPIHERATRFYSTTILYVENASLFKTGDYVLAHFGCRFLSDAAANPVMYTDAWVESGVERIIRIDGNLVELEHDISFGTLDNIYTDYVNHYVDGYGEAFFKVLNGATPESTGHNKTLLPLSGKCYLMRAYSTRVKKMRECLTKEEITFHTSFPSLTELEMFVPQQETGNEYDEISRETTVNPATWKNMVASGAWFIYAEPKVAYDAAHGIYELRVKKTPCV